MASLDFLQKLKGKKIHVDFWDSEEKEFFSTEGVLANFDDYSIEVESETDFDKIAQKDIKKIYLK